MLSPHDHHEAPASAAPASALQALAQALDAVSHTPPVEFVLTMPSGRSKNKRRRGMIPLALEDTPLAFFEVSDGQSAAEAEADSNRVLAEYDEEEGEMSDSDEEYPAGAVGGGGTKRFRDDSDDEGEGKSDYGGGSDDEY